MVMTDSGNLAQLSDFISTYGLHGAVIKKEAEERRGGS